MKEKKTVPEKTIVIDIKLTRRVVVVLSCVLTIAALLAYLMLTRESAAAVGEASPAQSNGMRQFYLTQSEVTGSGPLTACARGYHFASLWELVDPSNLKYDPNRGINEDDSGEGPPSDIWGWVRTGYQSDSLGTAGQANCGAWGGTTGYGTTAGLHPNWGGDVEHVGVWNVNRLECYWTSPVWCIED